MRILKNVGVLAIAFALFITSLTIPAYRAQAVDYSVQASPRVLEGAGYVDLTFLVTNTGESSMTDISLVCESVSYKMPGIAIAAGAQQELFLSNYHVRDEQIGTDIVFMLNWIEQTEFKTQAMHVRIERGTQPTPTVEPTIPQDLEMLSFSYSVNKPYAEKDSEVVFTYVITNISNSTVTGINLLDTGIAGNTPIVSNVSIQAGQDYTKTYTYKMGEESVTASPVLTYVGALGTNKTIRGETKKIERVTVDMAVTVSQGETTESGTPFTITVTNNGNKTITNIAITDDLGESAARKFNLGIGESKEVVHTVSSKKERTLYFNVSCTLATGEADSVKTDSYHVWQYTDPALIGIQFDVELVETMNAEGYVTVKFTAKNTAEKTMSDIEIHEREALVGSLKNLAAGESDTATYNVYAQGAEELNFVLTAKDPTGKPWNYNTIISSTEFVTVDDKPGATPYAPPFSPGSVVSGTLTKILVVLAIMAGIAGVALIVLAVLERREVMRIRENNKRRNGEV